VIIMMNKVITLMNFAIHVRKMNVLYKLIQQSVMKLMNSCVMMGLAFFKNFFVMGHMN